MRLAEALKQQGSELELVMAAQLRSLRHLPAPVREHQFHPTRKWRFDFAWPVQRLALEVEGGTWTGGDHNRPQRFEGDCEKYNEATIAGWRVIRVTGDMVNDGRALAFVERALTGDQP